ncbi:phage tail fiber protein [Salmonella enterica subsp. enterica serovar Panama]
MASQFLSGSCASSNCSGKNISPHTLRCPVFARNEIDGLTNGDPVDIPADSFVSVRVEIPPDSIWNQKQEAAHIAIEQAMMKEERTDGNNV